MYFHIAVSLTRDTIKCHFSQVRDIHEVVREKANRLKLNSTWHQVSDFLPEAGPDVLFDLGLIEESLLLGLTQHGLEATPVVVVALFTPCHQLRIDLCVGPL